jgi:hypothetical protein
MYAIWPWLPLPARAAAHSTAPTSTAIRLMTDGAQVWIETEK